MESKVHDIIVANGDGIGPEIMNAVLEILRAAECPLRFETIDIGENMYKKGWSSGIPESAWEKIKMTKILLKAPITTPIGEGYKSLNVTLRRKLGLNINVRPCKTYLPFIGKKPIDMIFMRENEEDLYCGVEFKRNHDIVECVKIISESSSTKICQYAFEYARQHNRKKVTCMVKDNIMKMTDGCFYKAFQKVAKHYPEITTDRYIVDIGAARIANNPEDFDVIVTENLYGDILSDIGAEISGSVGIAGSANLGDEYAMFEAVHGSAPNMQANTANPSGLLNAAIMMLRHLQIHDKAEIIENAWLCVLESGIHTKDLQSENTQQIVGTEEFSKAIIERLGDKPQQIQSNHGNYEHNTQQSIKTIEIPLVTDQSKQELVGFDLSINIKPESDSDIISQKINEQLHPNLKVRAMSSKGMKIWPQKPLKINPYTYVKVRIASANNPGQPVSYQDIAESLKNVDRAGIDICRIDSLYAFDEIPGFAPPQGD